MDEKLKIIISAQITEAQKNLKDIQNQLGEVGEKSSKNSEKFKKAMSAIGNAAKEAAKITAKAFVALGSGVAALAGAAVKSYADYEQLVGGVETLFKDSAGIIQEYANEAYKTAGLSANEYMEQATGFSASLLQSLGGDTKAAAELTNQAIIDMSDNANKMGSDIESIQNAYQGFAKQNYTMLDNLKLGYGGTKQEMERLLADAEKLTGVKYDISNFSDIIEAIHAVQDEMDITGTTAKEASTTISGSIGMVKASWSNLLVSIADDNADFDTLINNFIESVSTAGKNILPRVEIALNGVATLIDKLFPVIMEKIPPVILSVLPKILNAATNIITALIEGLVQAFPKVVETLSSLLPGIVETLVALIPKITGAILDALPMLLSTVIKVISAIIQGLAEVLPQIIEQVVAILPEIIDALIDGIPLLLEASIQLFMALVKAIPQIIPPLIDALPQIINTIINAVTEFLPQLIDASIELFMAFVEAIPEIIPALIDALPQIIDAIIDATIKLIPELLKAAVKLFMAYVEAIGKIIPKLIIALGDIIQTVNTHLKEKISQIFEKIKNTMKDKIESAKTSVVDTFTSLKSNISDKIKEIKDNVSEKFNAIKEGITKPIEKAKETVKELIDKIKSCFNFKWSLPKLKLPHISISGRFSLFPLSVPRFSIQWYKNGGVFDNPTLFSYGGKIGGLGENGAEAVVPLEKNTKWLDRLASMLAEKQGGSRPIVLQVDGRTFAEISVESINQLTRQRGSLPLKLV